MSVKTLNQLEPGERATIVRVGGERAVRRRILDMGVVKGAEIEAVRVAPLGDPIEFLIKGYNLSLRKSEAQQIQVEV
jgi:Fe2+ transport system protein FeoA